MNDEIREFQEVARNIVAADDERELIISSMAHIDSSMDMDEFIENLSHALRTMRGYGKLVPCALRVASDQAEHVPLD